MEGTAYVIEQLGMSLRQHVHELGEHKNLVQELRGRISDLEQELNKAHNQEARPEGRPAR